MVEGGSLEYAIRGSCPWVTAELTCPGRYAPGGGAIASLVATVTGANTSHLDAIACRARGRPGRGNCLCGRLWRDSQSVGH
jgi:hypothetical protein